MANPIEVILPSSQGQKDVLVTTQTSQVNSDPNVVVSAINLVNKYLWFTLGIVAMAMIVYAGITLITARGDKKAMSKVRGILLNVIIGLLIALFAFVLVRLAVNLF